MFGTVQPFLAGTYPQVMPDLREDWNEDLKRRATSLRERLASQEDRPDRPLFVEFSGTPKSGKSTCIDIVGHFFRRTGYRTLAPTEGASKRTPYYLKDDLTAFNVWSACYALTHILEASHHSDRFHLGILDRGIFDALAWFELLAADGAIPRDQASTIQDFLTIDKWRSVTDTVFLFTVDAATSIKRENAEKIIGDPGRAMNPEFLKRLNDAYESVHGRFVALFPRITRVDTSDTTGSTPKTTAGQITSEILDAIENRLGEE